MREPVTPRLIIHGGAGRQEGAHLDWQQIDRSLRDAAEAGYRVLLAEDAQAAALAAIRLLEDDPLFNAGTGSKLQRDGRVRMSAALMGGEQGRFSGVINVEDVRHPIDLAALLAGERHTVLAGEPATAWARAQGLPPHDPIIPERRAEYEQARQEAAGTVGTTGTVGTVGAVALDAQGHIVAATSTGGIGYETPGRVSDSATVGGNYAAPTAGVSCTGVGEHIVSHAAAARVVIRVQDGMELSQAVRVTIAEAEARRFRFGLIALDRHGQAVVGRTAGMEVFSAIHDGRAVRTFLDPP